MSRYDEDASTLDATHDAPMVQVSSRPRTSEVPQLGRDRGQLIILVGNGAGRTFDLGDDTLIGRTPEAQVQIAAEDSSRRHARIRRTAAGFVLEDLGSRNGTLVNGVPVKEQALKLGDKIRIGAKTILMFTQHDELEDLLLQSQKLESIGHLAGGIAHDFNNLLGAILANTCFLKGLSPQVGLGESDVVEALADIDVAARRAADLTTQLLGFSRRGSCEKEQVSVNNLVEELRSLLSRTIGKTIQLSVELEPDLVVVGDSSQLHQVIMNLCINARDAMPAGGVLKISGRLCHLSEVQVLTYPFLLPGKYVAVAVDDTGVGMEPETLRRAFEPFFTTKSRGEGTGMGLATAYGIVKNHGGHIQAESQVGRGSRFSVYLPAADAPSRTTEVQKLDQASPLLTRRMHRGLVLVVDDEELFRNSARRLLEGLGYGVLCAADGPRAIELLRANHELVELVLLDVVMPTMGGVEVFHELRKIKPTVKVLLNSGQAELHAVRALLAAGADAFLQKPYGVGALAEALSKAVARK